MTLPGGAPAADARERSLLAAYAQSSSETAGRRHLEPPHPYRSPYQRDRDRLVHSAAFRRLSQKTQVFTGDLGDYHRTRLTHTLEVASIARTLGRALRLNEDLVEALALMHDLGHPPFGHAGEDALSERLSAWGGFSHNRHALRLIEKLEQRYPAFPGLNLSWELVECQEARIHKADSLWRPLLEAQVVDAADSAAYDTHDADDALELGLIRLEDLLETSLWRQAAQRVRARYADLRGQELRRAVLHELIDWQVSDLLRSTNGRLAEFGIASVADVRRAPLCVRPSAEMREPKHELEQFLFLRVYRHPDLLRVRQEAQACLQELFDALLSHPERLPEAYLRRAAEDGLPRSVGDYVAGMTDRFALQEHARWREP